MSVQISNREPILAPVPSARRRAAEEQESLLSYCLQGAGFLGFMLFLFWVAGLRF